MKKKLFQYAVILHKFKAAKEGEPVAGTIYEDSELIIEPTMILAKNEKDVVFKVTRLIPEEHADNPDNVEILIRPF